MKAHSLKLSATLSLPLEVATGVVGVVGKRGSGKTSTAIVFVEELLFAEAHVVIIDPQGVAWGLQAGRTPNTAGFSITVLGGSHGNLPLEPTAGATIADLIVDEHVSLVLDLSLFGRNEQTTFMSAFAERLFKRKGAINDPLTLVIDEAQHFLPQSRFHGHEAVMLGHMERLILSGRNRGIGALLLTQRPAIINKNVLEEIDTLIALRLMGPNDKAAVRRWLGDNLPEANLNKLMTEIGSFEKGRGYVWSPDYDIARMVHFRGTTTYDSRRSPTQVRATPPKRLAPVDLAALEKRMAATIERAKADNPATLKAEIAKLRAENARLAAAKPTAPNPHEERERAQQQAIQIRDAVHEAEGRIVSRMRELVRDVNAKTTAVLNQLENEVEGDRKFNSRPKVTPPREAFEIARQSMAAARHTNGLDHNEIGGMKTGERAILTAIAQLEPEGATRPQIALLSGYSAPGTLRTYFARLQARDYINSHGGLFHTTDAGIAALGTNWTPRPTGPALADWWAAKLKAGAAAMLRAYIEAGRGLHPSEAGEAAGYSAPGTVRTYNATLRSCNLIVPCGGGKYQMADALR